MIINEPLIILLIFIFSLKIIKCREIDENDVEEEEEEENYFNIFYQTDFSMEQVLKLNVIECNNEKDSSCPEYTSGCQYYLNTRKFNNTINHDYYCKYNFICRAGENCVFFDSDNTYLEKDSGEKGIRYRNKNNIYQYLILHSCNSIWFEKGKCRTDPCINNSDCFSGLCINSTCITDPENPAYICSLRDDNTSELIACKLNHQEYCKYNEDCHSNVCLDNLCINLNEKNKELETGVNEKKEKEKEREKGNDKERNYLELTIFVLLALISFFTIIFIGATFCCMFCQIPLVLNKSPQPFTSSTSSKRHLKASESETIYIINENNELIRTKLKMLDSCHSNHSHSSKSSKHRDKKRVLTMI